MSDKTRLACLDLNRNVKDRIIINDDNMAIIIHVTVYTNVKLAVDNQNIYSFNWNIRSIKAHKLNLRLCALKKVSKANRKRPLPF